MNKALVYEKVFADGHGHLCQSHWHDVEKNVLASLVWISWEGKLCKWLWRAGRKNFSHQLYLETWEISNSNRCFFFLQKKNLTFCAPKTKW